MLEKVYEIREYLGNHKVIFWYNGPISQFLVVEIGDMIKKVIAKDSEKAVITKIFSILVEQMQNIIKYSVEKSFYGNADDDLPVGSGLISVGIEGDHYYIVSGNLLLNEDIVRVRERLDMISEMDKATQKEYYKTLRRKESHPKSKGAGIGFVEMARKSSRPLEYCFKKIDEKHTFFSLKALVKAEV